VAEVREKGPKRFHAWDQRLIALYVLLAVVVGIASIVGATGDHLLRTLGGVFALTACSAPTGSLVQGLTHAPVGAGRQIERPFLTLSRHAESDADAGKEATLAVWAERSFADVPGPAAVNDFRARERASSMDARSALCLRAREGSRL
jgi:hypothetical protein